MEYKGNQEELQQKVDGLEKQLRATEDLLEAKRKQFEEELQNRVERVLKARAFLMTKEVGYRRERVVQCAHLRKVIGELSF